MVRCPMSNFALHVQGLTPVEFSFRNSLLKAPKEQYFQSSLQLVAAACKINAALGLESMSSCRDSADEQAQTCANLFEGANMPRANGFVPEGAYPGHSSAAAHPVLRGSTFSPLRA
jgi:hypothetical protein